MAIHRPAIWEMSDRVEYAWLDSVLRYDRRGQPHSWDRHRDICGDLPFPSVPAGTAHVAAQRAFPFGAERPSRSKASRAYLDPHAAGCGRAHCSTGTTALVFRKCESGGRPDGPGNGQDVVLDLSISG